MTSTKTAMTAMALTATIGLAAASWVFSIWQMKGMDLGVATPLGSFISFIVMWAIMMSAMMLPGMVPTVLRHAHESGSVGSILLFVGAYLAVWGLFGIPVYALYRPHGTFVVGLITIAAGIYEFTPLKKFFRLHCIGNIRSGFEFGLYCVGSSIGLMLMQVALGIMSLTWMVFIAIIICAQKLLPIRAAFDVPLALMIIGLGILILIAPSMVPGLMPPM